MNNPNTNQLSFFALLRAGLWEQKVQLSQFQNVDFSYIYKLAEEQSVVGLVAAGLEHVTDIKVPKDIALLFAGNVMQLEQRNTAMNSFIRVIVDKLRMADVYTLLVKGQGIAQSYEKPLWRTCGDIDLLLNSDNYQRASALLASIASHVDEENPYNKHIAMTIEGWEVELHGNLRCGLWRSIDNALDSINNTLFYEGKVRSWMNGNTQVFLPNDDEDIVYVFSHILQHFYREGVGLRQICDLARLIWTYKDSIDKDLLKKRLRDMGTETEWKSFAALMVDYLGMPCEAVPFYSVEKKWKRKADRVLSFVMETGNMGHSRDWSYFTKYPYIIRKAISLWRHSCDHVRYFTIFPLDSIKTWNSMIVRGTREAIKGSNV